MSSTKNTENLSLPEKKNGLEIEKKSRTIVVTEDDALDHLSQILVEAFLEYQHEKHRKSN